MERNTHSNDAATQQTTFGSTFGDVSQDDDDGTDVPTHHSVIKTHMDWICNEKIGGGVLPDNNAVPRYDPETIKRAVAE